VIYSFSVGLVPLHYVDDSQQGLVFLPALGTGAVFAAPFILIFNYFYTKPDVRKRPEFHWKEVSLYGILSGMIWNSNNIVAVGAIPVLGYGVVSRVFFFTDSFSFLYSLVKVFPIIQCALFVAGMWGIFFFKELKGNTVRVFFASGFVLIIGAIMLSLGS
jgi:glucose uptake protein GlcU